MSTHINRARGKGIVFEYAAPEKKSSKAIVILGGTPAVPYKKDAISFFVAKGLWVFFPRYRGTWESDGEFLAKPLEQDVFDLLSVIEKGFVDAWTEEKVTPKIKQFYLLGNSTGGAVALCAAYDRRITKAIAFSPVIDWSAETKQEPMKLTYRFTKDAFGGAYRFTDANWKKLADGKITNPATHKKPIPKEKVVIFAADDDTVVPAILTRDFAGDRNIEAYFSKKGGHIGTMEAISPKIFKLYKKHLGL